jgi:hypothetical protein
MKTKGSPCSPGCLGIVVSDTDFDPPEGWVHLERCDECDVFEDDFEAAKSISPSAKSWCVDCAAFSSGCDKAGAHRWRVIASVQDAEHAGLLGKMECEEEEEEGYDWERVHTLLDEGIEQTLTLAGVKSVVVPLLRAELKRRLENSRDLERVASGVLEFYTVFLRAALRAGRLEEGVFVLSNEELASLRKRMHDEFVRETYEFVRGEMRGAAHAAARQLISEMIQKRLLFGNRR